LSSPPADRLAWRPGLIDRDFTAQAPGERLVGDITYLRTGAGWLCLATVIDLATRMVVGWQLAEHMRTSLVITHSSSVSSWCPTRRPRQRQAPVAEQPDGPGRRAAENGMALAPPAI